MFHAKPYTPPPVDSDEMSFAVALFVAAARGKIAPPNMSTRSGDRNSVLQDSPLLLGAKAVLRGEPARLPDEVPLVCAVSVLWHHYHQHALQQAICSRLVAFHAWFAHRQEALTAARRQEPETYLVEAAQSPAILQAVARATVGEDGLFDVAEFELLVDSYSRGEQAQGVLSFYKPASRRRAPRLSVTEDVQQLSLQILAFQSCVAASPAGAGPHFLTVRQLCLRIEDMSGAATLHAMLSRAWRATLTDFPWLKSASTPSAGLAADFDADWPAPSPREAMKCEMAMLGFLIELLRVLLGDAVTVQLLRSLWPLADLGRDRHLLAQYQGSRKSLDFSVTASKL